MSDLISRADAISVLDNFTQTDTLGHTPRQIVEALPSAQPEQTNSWCINSWCINCKEYDTENKCCPRYNRVIKQTLDDAYRHGETDAEARFHAQQRWIPCSERLPDEYGNYLISIKGEEPDIGTINPNDPRGWSLCDANGFYWANDKMLNIIAWMPLPEPYKEQPEGGAV